MVKYIANKNDEGQTLFKFVKKTQKDTKLSIIYKWFRIGNIKVNNKRIKNNNYIIKENDEIIIYDTSAKKELRDKVETVDFSTLKVIYEDKNILIADKDANVEMHSQYNISLDQIIKSYLISKNDYKIENENSFVISHINRIDKLTSGLVIYAKNKEAQAYFLQAIKNKNQIQKTYIAKIEGVYQGPLVVKGYLKYDEDKKQSLFSLEEKKDYKKCSMEVKQISKEVIEIKLHTGRKHQIRAVLAYYKSPIVGDFRYGAKKTFDKKIDLISKKLEFNNMEKFEYLNKQSFESDRHF
ncbi:RluA family pseudouridine synthase [Spiroplasma endosymbiont of Crioceris asparagi]|uniref:RluA family pseudouridine synthase n=1 Tax=Spiroplasma endosymbiont of Crioceris asparagi TaxID=3066286 RepID=UPI0030D46C32